MKKLKTYVCAYAYDMPHYVDFKVEAANEKEAKKIIERALREKEFDNVIAEPDGDIDFMRVFVMQEVTDERDREYLPSLKELITQNNEETLQE
jgi:hypothetical protein